MARAWPAVCLGRGKLEQSPGTMESWVGLYLLVFGHHSPLADIAGGRGEVLHICVHLKLEVPFE